MSISSHKLVGLDYVDEQVRLAQKFMNTTIEKHVMKSEGNSAAHA